MAEQPGSRRWTPRRVAAVVAAALVGTAVGLGGFTVAYSEAPSYLGTDPQTCVNCHVMQPQYEAWQKGSHSEVAKCTDCHLPHGSVIEKYLVKAEDGYLHTTAFTTGNYPANIEIRDRSLEVVNGACLSCHAAVTSQMNTDPITGDTISCARCHAGVGHDD
ncbi:MAG: cytochrome c nitrite reductase small subunit [Micrococcales bacterium]|nr:cytochrome c nitrite reductase small subunit [Micrococcales bacterium]